MDEFWNWFIEKLLSLNHPKHLLVGACLCYGLQSQSPNDPHLHVEMEYNPRVQGTPGPLWWHQNEYTTSFRKDLVRRRKKHKIKFFD